MSGVVLRMSEAAPAVAGSQLRAANPLASSLNAGCRDRESSGSLSSARSRPYWAGLANAPEFPLLTTMTGNHDQRLDDSDCISSITVKSAGAPIRRRRKRRRPEARRLGRSVQHEAADMVSLVVSCAAGRN
uniref:Uncharacterized protein n=1 Tax=Rhodopseudomonas palustris (strain BisA53) TaxID=316055 RepID=Q07I92_RHOP5